MENVDIANRTYIFFAYQYYIRSLILENNFDDITKYINSSYDPTIFHHVFGLDIKFNYLYQIRTNKDKKSVDCNILDSPLHCSDPWVKHEIKNDKKSVEKINLFYLAYDLPKLDPLGLFPFSPHEVSEEGTPITMELYHPILIKKGYQKKYLLKSLELMIDNNMLLDENFFDKNTYKIIKLYITHHNLITMNKVMRMKNRVFGLWMLDYAIKNGLNITNPYPAIKELCLFDESINENKMIDVYKKTLQSVLVRDLYKMSN